MVADTQNTSFATWSYKNHTIKVIKICHSSFSLLFRSLYGKYVDIHQTFCSNNDFFHVSYKDVLQTITVTGCFFSVFCCIWMLLKNATTLRPTDSSYFPNEKTLPLIYIAIYQVCRLQIALYSPSYTRTRNVMFVTCNSAHEIYVGYNSQRCIFEYPQFLVNVIHDLWSVNELFSMLKINLRTRSKKNLF